MTVFHDPLPPDVACTPELHEAFEDWMDTMTERVRNGYRARPSTMMLIAYLGGRADERAAAAPAAQARRKLLVDMFNSMERVG